MAALCWPNLRSIDIFGVGNAHLPDQMPVMPRCLSTLFLADSTCTDDELDRILTLIPNGLQVRCAARRRLIGQELGLSWCPRLSQSGLVDILRKHGRSIHLLTLVSAPSYRPVAPFVLDAAVQHCAQLQVVDVEGPVCRLLSSGQPNPVQWLSDLALAKLSSTVRAIVVGKCASLTAAGVASALDAGKLAGLARLAVVLGADYEHPSGMNWTKPEKQRVVEACERRRITWQTKWSCASQSIWHR